jgi:Protein of unknown function (DUF3154).
MNPLVNILVGPIFETISKVIDRVWPDPQQAAAAKLEMFKMQQAGEFKEIDTDLQLMLGQLEVNKAEASSGNWYAASWRPTIGYICCLALAGQFIAHPIVMWYVAYAHLNISIPAFDFGPLMTIVLSLLGVGGLRTLEKIKGVAA